MTFGLPGLGATNNDAGLPDRSFVSSLTQLRWGMRFPELRYTEIAFRADLQLTDDPLMTIEQISAGGLYTVRGYPENQLIRDSAAIASLEVRLPLYGDPARSHFLQLAPFIDVARGWSKDRFEPDGLGGRVKINPGSKTLAGTGLGLRYRFRRFLRAELYWGANLTSDADVPSSGQSHGVHFRIRAEIP
jgi:hemolysin activation/secretion protein